VSDARWQAALYGPPHRRLAPELRHRGLDHVAAFFGIENPARHRAFGDALATAHVLRALLERARERGVESWSS